MAGSGPGPPSGCGAIPGLDHQHELVTAHPGHGVPHAQHRTEPGGGLDQHRVAGRMAGRVIHLLEPVEVTEQDGDLAAFPGRPGQGGLQAVEEQGPIRQSGKGVVQRTVRQLLLRLHDVG